MEFFAEIEVTHDASSRFFLENFFNFLFSSEKKMSFSWVSEF